MLRIATNCNIKTDGIFYVYCGKGNKSLLNCSILEPGWLGNPVIKNKECYQCGVLNRTNADTLPCYRLKNSEFAKTFYSLRGKKLACWCKPNYCHTDVMIEFFNK